MRKLEFLGRIAALAAIIAAGTISTAAAQAEKPKIALYIANDKLKPEEKNVLTRKFLSPFTASGLYSIIDRSDIFTQKANQERIKQRDGSVNEKEIYKIGYEAGAKYVCMVELDYAFGRWNVAARMVNVVTAEIYLTQGETDIAGELDKADISGAAKTIFNQIHGRSGSVTQTQGQTPTKQTSTPTPTPTPPPPPPTPTPPPPSINYSSLRDARDGKTYKTVVIGGKTWMAENLNYQTSSGSWCYENKSSNCGKYGRLYDFQTAAAACPTGFHLPSPEEWNNLVVTTGGEKAAGKKLKAKHGWDKRDDRSNGNGTDNYGFSALPGGYWLPTESHFRYAGFRSGWWGATTLPEADDYAYCWNMYSNYDEVGELGNRKSGGLSVRCVADN